jgi:ribonucleoside-triphosphate reductase
MGQCDRSVEVFSRITGYFRPVANWNVAKVQEFKDRKLFTNINGKPSE